MVTKRDVEFVAEDGTTLRGSLFVPPEGRGPAVVMAHGFSGVAAQIQHYSEVFAAAGLSTLVFDHRGFGRSDGTPRVEVDPWRQLSDWRDAIGFVLEQDAVDESAPVGVWGSSFAGGLAMVLAATDRRIACVVAQIPNVGGHRNGSMLFNVADRKRLEEPPSTARPVGQFRSPSGQNRLLHVRTVSTARQRIRRPLGIRHLPWLAAFSGAGGAELCDQGLDAVGIVRWA